MQRVPPVLPVLWPSDSGEDEDYQTDRMCQEYQHLSPASLTDRWFERKNWSIEKN